MSKDTEAPVTWSVDKSLATVTLNRPDTRNAMTGELRDGLRSALESITGKSQVRAIVLTGKGSAFSAGGDLDFMRGLPQQNPASVYDQLASIYPPFIELLRLPCPTIAAVNGPAVGGGLGIALLCDIRVASTSAVFSAPFGVVGLPPGMGLTVLLPLILGHGPALDLFLTSRSLDADEALRSGLVSSVVEDDNLLDEAEAIGQRIAGSSPAVIEVIAERMRGRVLREVESALSTEVRSQALAVYTSDYQEGLDALIEGRRPDFESEA